MAVKNLLAAQKKRRERLKNALRRYAKNFAMEYWFTYTGNPSVTPSRSTFAGKLNEYLTSVFSREKKFNIHKTLKSFEECGTSCCIAGMGHVLTGKPLREIAKHYGIAERDSDISGAFYEGNWPIEIRRDYRNARDSRDYNGMVEAACKAIDHFAAKALEE